MSSFVNNEKFDRKNIFAQKTKHSNQDVIISIWFVSRIPVEHRRPQRVNTMLMFVLTILKVLERMMMQVSRLRGSLYQLITPALHRSGIRRLRRPAEAGR